ncbi:SMI1/KNR4 family protein [Actinoplanes solisilvae]|uniref:SMI1/KNR4 family protein n=1 Tax=Actinoplanes solisilvae TaxID=2486853 RepID=UPI000FD75D4A|nr:SMI1/KNR4 family protein [Actinoplanes solisilvae]
MNWVERIMEAVGSRRDPQGPGWEQVEAELGVTLPADFKELSARFGDGSFSDYLILLQPNADQGLTPLLSMWSTALRQTRVDPLGARWYEPYEYYAPETGQGLIPWGYDIIEGNYFWLADRSVEAERWPVIAQKEGEACLRFDIAAAEFLHRMLTNPEFKPFTVADPPRLPFWVPPSAPYPLSDEEREALSSPNRAD